MKKLLFFVAIATSIFSCKEKQKDSYTIKGNIAGLESPYVYISYPNGDSLFMDSAKVNNGDFTFEGKIQEPTFGNLHTPDGRGLSLIIENAAIQITGNADSLDKAEIKGGETQNEFNAYQVSTKDLENEMRTFYQGIRKAQEKNDTVSMNQLMPKEIELNEKIIAANRKYITEHPKSYVSLFLLNNLGDVLPQADFEKLYHGMDKSFQTSIAGKKLASKMETVKITSVGATAMDFTQNDMDGKPVKLSDFKGKYVLLDFWASWCKPCRAENPNVLAAYNQFKDKNFTVLAVSLDMNEADWKKAIKDDGMPWTQLSDLKGPENNASKMYGVQGIPANFLIDPNGKIIAKDLRGEDLDKKLTEVLN